MPKSKILTVRYCTWCEMYHDETTPHLNDEQKSESWDYDVYHANGTIYFSVDHVKDQTE